MKFAIISAGEGSRLSQEGVALPKPLVQLNGVAMIDRLIQIFVRNGADKVVVIINNDKRAFGKTTGRSKDPIGSSCENYPQFHAQFL